MIPWSLSFSGVRDYPATMMDMSGRDQHVLVTGPNGAGKSTITYCMGAVLYSSKVDVEGLRSRNLPSDQTWKAQISFLFKNVGAMKIDAPDFIEFTLRIVQEPGQPMRKEFNIATGDEAGQWGETIRYTSGDSRYNFTAYKKDLMYKYKVDPDHFYLIWYQQEVNQFAVMHPEERFRIFSEMHGIDKVQQDWEASMEAMKETKETLRAAEMNVKNSKLLLSMKKRELDRYEDNRRRLNEGGNLYTQSLLLLESYYKMEQEGLGEFIEELKGQIEDSQEELADIRSRKEDAQESLKILEGKLQGLQTDIENHEKIAADTKEEIRKLKEVIDELEDELKEITEKRNRLVQTESEVKEALLRTSQELDGTSKAQGELQQQLYEFDRQWRVKIDSVAGLRQQIRNDEEQEQKHAERLQQYESSHRVQEQINRLTQTIQANTEERSDSSNRMTSLSDELQRLEEERDLSTRQMESIQYARSLKLQAYPLRELVELDHTARLKDEDRFNAIKYTIFFDGNSLTPPNDLYHVSLRRIVPERSVTALPELHLRVKEGLDDAKTPHAMKVLWWVEQFFKGGAFVIQNGVLHDPMGIRGPQETDRFILSARALAARKQEVGKMIGDLARRVMELDQAIEHDTKTWQESNSIIHLVKEAEAFMTNEYERVARRHKLDAEAAAERQLSDEINRLRDRQKLLMEQRAHKELLIEGLQEQAELYRQLGQLKDRYELLHHTQKEHDRLSRSYKKTQSHIADLSEQQDEMEASKRRAERTLGKIEDELESHERNLELMVKQLKNKQDSMDLAQNKHVEVIREIEDLKQLVPEIYNHARDSLNRDVHLTLAQLRDDLERGKTTFRQARQEEGIDPSAADNYKVIKEETDRLAEEYQRTSILLEQDEERADKLKDQLETTINMRVLELQQRFKSYMSEFQFEGEISWETYEDKRNRTHFQLYIKARKEGHRGALEDVSVKARGGKVGKGVSGGEESLSSLLFALVLLQNLQASPGFIVLDEFDSALDESRKLKVFDLYVRELKRKLLILTPKSHEESYLGRFARAFIVQHDPTVPKSKVVGLLKTE